MTVSSPESPSRDTCAFCGFRLGKGPGERERSNEHILTGWFLDLIPHAEGGRVFHQRFTPDGGEQNWTADGLEVSVKRVCVPCNTGWMNDLDHAAAPFLEPLFHGRGKRLYEEGQTKIAAWATKTALALQLTAPKGQLAAPTDHYREIEITKLPPRWTSVWLAAYEDLPRVGFQQGYVMTVDGMHCHSATTLLGHMVVQVAGNVGHQEVTWERPAWDKAVIPIWPYRGSVDWPPQHVIGERNLGPLTGRLVYD